MNINITIYILKRQKKKKNKNFFILMTTLSFHYARKTKKTNEPECQFNFFSRIIKLFYCKKNKKTKFTPD